VPGPRTSLPRDWYAWPADAPPPRAIEPRVKCEDCRHFIPNRINPSAAISSCAEGLIGQYPASLHYCRTFKPRNP
jgi:hypothetical protein